MASTGLDLFSIQEDIKAKVATDLGGWQVTTGGVEEAFEIAHTSGMQNPYVVLRFGDAIEEPRDKSFFGPRYDGYSAMLDAICVGRTDAEARQLASWVMNILLGYKPANAGAIRKNFGGGNFYQPANNSVPQYFIATSAFRFTFNTIVDGTGNEGA